MSLLITYYRLHNPGASTNSFPFCRAQLFTVPHLQFLWHSTLDPEALNIVQEVNLWIKGELMNKSIYFMNIYFRNTPIYFTVSVFVSSCQTRKSNQKQWLSWCLNWLRAADGKPTFFAAADPCNQVAAAQQRSVNHVKARVGSRAGPGTRVRGPGSGGAGWGQI